MEYNCKSSIIKIGNRFDLAFHLIKSRMSDRHGFGSTHATKVLLKRIIKLDPDIIHLHNLHGYYINVKVLFDYLRTANKPVVWTLHDCWPFTGHCSHFQYVGCSKWLTGCYDCPNIQGYPKSWYIDNSKLNYSEKKALFNGIRQMVIVSPSEWLQIIYEIHFLSGHSIRVINNGVACNLFNPTDCNRY